MTPLDRMTEQVVAAIMQVIELCYQQGVTTTWRNIYLFLRFPQEAWQDEEDLDERIVIMSDEDLTTMKAMLKTKFLLKRSGL
jgi:hypothetical protein